MAGERVSTTETLSPAQLGERAYKTMGELAYQLAENPYFARNAAKLFFGVSTGEAPNSISFAPSYGTDDGTTYVAAFNSEPTSNGEQSGAKLSLTLQRFRQIRGFEKEDEGKLELSSEFLKTESGERQFLDGKVSLPGAEDNSVGAFRSIRGFLKGFYPTL